MDRWRTPLQTQPVLSTSSHHIPTGKGVKWAAGDRRGASDHGQFALPGIRPVRRANASCPVEIAHDGSKPAPWTESGTRRRAPADTERCPDVGSMNRIMGIAGGVLFLKAAAVSAATVLFCPFDSLEGWSVRAVGATSTAIVDASQANRCVQVTSRRGTVFVTRQLPLDAVQGSRVTVSCLAKSENVVTGPQLSSTAKVHLAVQTPDTTSSDWRSFPRARSSGKACLL